MLGFCLHNYRYSQGKFRCSKCGHTTYGADTTYEFKDDEESYVKPLSNQIIYTSMIQFITFIFTNNPPGNKKYC